MVDVILFLFVCFVFASGFWCGKTYGTTKAMLARAKAWLSALFTAAPKP